MRSHWKTYHPQLEIRKNIRGGDDDRKPSGMPVLMLAMILLAMLAMAGSAPL